VLTIILALSASARAEPKDHLNAIIRGPAFGELGAHGQAAALYLAAIQAPSWAESERLLQRIWEEYPGSAAVDVAHAFAGRHYRDAGDKTQAIAHFEQALRAARERSRPWTGLLEGELTALGERVAQAPGPPGGAPAADEWVEVTPDSGHGEWTSLPPVRTDITPLPEERAWSFAPSIPDPEALACPACLQLKDPFVVVAASFRVKAPPTVAFTVSFTDTDGTTVYADSHRVKPDADGWRSFAVDFAQEPFSKANLAGAKPADSVMGPLDWIHLFLRPPVPLGEPPLEIVVSDLKLKLGEPVRESNAPMGGAPQPGGIVTDDAGWRWQSAGGQARLDDAMAREGVPSVRMSVEVDPSATGGLPKLVMARPPAEGGPWLGDRLVFWCFPQTAPYLQVSIASGQFTNVADTPDGMTTTFKGMDLIKVLDADDLTVGQWNRVEIVFADVKMRMNAQDTFGEISHVSFRPGLREPGAREAFSKPGEYVWYINGLHLEGRGPVVFRRPAPEIPDLGLDAVWSTEGACTLQPEGRTTATGPGALRMDVAFAEDRLSGGEARAMPPGGGAWLGTRLRFACRAENVPLLIVEASDSDGTTVMWLLTERDLVPGQWQSIELSPETQHNMGHGDDRMDDIASLVFSCNRAWDPGGSSTAAGSVGTWYLDDLQIEGPPTATRPPPLRPGVGVRDDSGTPATWTGWARVMVDRELVTVRDGAASVRLTLLPERTGAHQAFARAGLDTPVAAGKLRFWVYPRQVAPLAVSLVHTEDRGSTTSMHDLASWQLAEDRLVPNTWNEVVLLVSERRVPPEAGGAERPEPADEVMFDMAGAGPKGDEQWTWYIDGLELVEGE
jgi:hypothetical protein